MGDSTEKFEILAIGLDSLTIEAIKKSLKEIGIVGRISFLHDIDDLEGLQKKSVDAVFYFSNKQPQKTGHDLRRLSLKFNRAAIILLSPKLEPQGVVDFLKSGLFDYLCLPVEKERLRQVISRLKMHEVIQAGDWSPERAVLHFFSRPESFLSVEDIAESLNHYLDLFFLIEKHVLYSSEFEMLKDLKETFQLNQHRQIRIARFLKDSFGLIFGLKFEKEKFHFLVKGGGNKFSYLVVKNKSSFAIHEIISDYLSNVLKTSLSIISDSSQREHIRNLSLTDEVTGLFNQRKLLEDLNYYISRYSIENRGFSLLFVDIDYFKNVNDQFGHIVGSQLLIDMASVLKTQLRSNDLVYRYGGDEFIVLLPSSGVEDSKKIAMRISEAVKEAEFNIDMQTKYKLSLSIGIAEYPSDADSAKSIIEFADKMMYLSKKSGRGKVFHITEVIA